MPKCSKCGKKFQTLSALNDHYRAVHPNEKFVAPKTSSSRNLLVGLVLVIIVVGAGVGLLIAYGPTGNSTKTGTTPFLNQPINATLYNQITGVSASTLAAIGNGAANTIGLQKPSATALTINGKPEFLYIGADYCPYCAVERWAMAVALSRFGTLSGMSYMLSGPNDGNISTLAFANTTLASNYIEFRAVETQDRSGNSYQKMTSDQQILFSQYDPVTGNCQTGGCIPFIDIANQYVIVGSQYALTPSIPSNIFTKLTWSQIGSQLNNQDSDIAKAVDGSANYLISMICKVDGNQPSEVCGQSFSQIPVAILPHVPIQAGGPLSIGVPTVLKASRLTLSGA